MTRTFNYTVKAGDTLSKIAAHINGVTLAEIEAANPHIDPNLIRIGQVIAIPSPEQNISPPPHKISPPSSTTTVAAENIGYWDWTWHDKPATPDTTIGLAFSGWTDVATALAQSKKVYNRLVGTKYICLGGGGKAGRFDAPSLQAVTNAINQDKFAAYQGIAYDVESGASGLATEFQASFSAAKAKGLKVLVTVSHSAPFGIHDAASLMHSFFADENIDFLSPQLYTTGKEKANDYTYAGVAWKDYATAKAAVIPSIVHASYYADAVSYFQEQGVTLKGFVRWSY